MNYNHELEIHFRGKCNSQHAGKSEDPGFILWNAEVFWLDFIHILNGISIIFKELQAFK